MGMQAQGQQGQVYYDNATGQYYTQPTQSNLMGGMFGLMRDKAQQRNYLSNFNNQSMIPTEPAKYNYVDIAALFPEMYQGDHT